MEIASIPTFSFPILDKFYALYTGRLVVNGTSTTQQQYI